MKSRRAIIATRVYAPEGTAAAFRLANLARGLERAGFEVLVLTTKAPDATRSTRTVRRWPVLRDSMGAVRGYLQYASFDVPLFFRLLFAPRADVVVVEPPPTTGFVSRIACWVRRTPYVYFSADVTSAAVRGIGVPRAIVELVTALEKFSLRGADAILAISDQIRDEVVKLGADVRKVTVVGTGIDTDIFTPNGPKVGAETPYFVYAGMMSEFQGAHVFVDAFKIVQQVKPEARLVMFGGGVDVDDLKMRANFSNGQIEFLGSVPPAEVAEWMRSATASLASIRPGQGYDFAFPTKALASISCGVPVIYAGPGPLAALIPDNELGWATPWSTDDVAAAMLEALAASTASPNLRLVSWVDKNYSLRAMAERAASAISVVVDTQSARHRPR
ncbi:glycosyltransferase family 4 protein [Rhodoglobus sp.]